MEEVSSLQMQSQQLLRRLEEYDYHLSLAGTAIAPPMAAKPANFSAAMKDLVEAHARIVGNDQRKARVKRVASMLPTTAPLLELRHIMELLGKPGVVKSEVRSLWGCFCLLFCLVFFGGRLTFCGGSSCSQCLHNHHSLFTDTIKWS